MENPKADIFDHISADHESLRGILCTLASGQMEVFRRRIIFQRMLPFFRAHIYAAEHSLLREGLNHGPVRSQVLSCLEENELTEVSLHRLNLATNDEIWEARLKVFCRILEGCLGEAEKVLPQLRNEMAAHKREELGMKYLDTKNKFHLSPVREIPVKPSLIYDQTGRVGYLIAWLFGVPAWLLLMVFLIRGH